MRFAQRLFLIAGIYGLVVLVPMYFLADLFGRQDPPAITHREYYYGFLGVAVAWQVLFLIVSRDPYRFRPMMIPSVLEKLGFGVAVLILFSAGQVSAGPMLSGCLDLVFAALFAYAYLLLGRRAAPPGAPAGD